MPSGSPQTGADSPSRRVPWQRPLVAALDGDRDPGIDAEVQRVRLTMQISGAFAEQAVEHQAEVGLREAFATNVG